MTNIEKTLKAEEAAKLAHDTIKALASHDVCSSAEEESNGNDSSYIDEED